MARMVYEKDVVIDIRHRLETYEQQQLFSDNVEEEDVPSTDGLQYSHAYLGSRQRSLKIRTYEGILKERLGFVEFGDALAKFLRTYAGVKVYGTDFDGDGFVGHQLCIFFFKVFFIHSSNHTLAAHR